MNKNKFDHIRIIDPPEKHQRVNWRLIGAVIVLALIFLLLVTLI